MYSFSVRAQCTYLPCGSASQGACVNHQKYWKHKERLKNFAVVGDCQGCSIAAGGRLIQISSESGKLDWSDNLLRDGIYIGMLAMEYKLLTDHPTAANQQQLNRTKEELFYAIEALNRLDKMAEYWWRYYYLEQGVNAQSLPSDLNGFMIRDDVPADFGDKFYNGDFIENQLNASLVPVSDGYKADAFTSGFTSGISEIGEKFGNACSQFNGKHVGPREVSLDQIPQVMAGLALVVKCVSADVSLAGKQFSDNETRFHQEAKNIAMRISNWLQSHQWTIINPVTGSCVKGVFWPDPHNFGDACKCIAGGALIEQESYGFAMANSYIQTGFNSSAALNFFITQYEGDPVIPTSRSFWNTSLKSGCHEFDSFILTYATIGNVWGSDVTPAILFGDRTRHDAQLHHLSLLYVALHNQGYTLSGDFYECLLDAAPCSDITRNSGLYEWSGGDRVLNSYCVENNCHGNCNKIAYPNDPALYTPMSRGIDYLFYFNLVNVVYPTYYGWGYEYVRPEDLCPQNITKQNYTETEHKNFYACNFITAQEDASGSDYTIANEPVNLPYEKAKVNFVAGNRIDLLPGFNVMPGAFFEAKIDHTLKPMQCTEPAESNCSEDWFFDDILNGRLTNVNNNKPDSIRMNNLVSKLNVNISPNPSDGRFILQFKESREGEVLIYNNLGQVVYQTKIISKQSSIDLSNYPKGIYFVKVQSTDPEGASKIYTEKIVVQ